MSDFVLNKLQWFEVKSSEENTFINDNLQSDEYGIYYSVGFVGDADTYLWQTKTPPVVGEKYWGMLQKAKSGKSTKFKWDKKNAPIQGDKPASAPKKDAFLRDVTTVPIDMIKCLLPYFDVQSLNNNPTQYRTLMELAQKLTEDTLMMVDNIRNTGSEKQPNQTQADTPARASKLDDVHIEDIPDDAVISLDDIPFGGDDD